jgi:hypothetical protein
MPNMEDREPRKRDTKPGKWDATETGKTDPLLT